MHVAMLCLQLGRCHSKKKMLSSTSVSVRTLLYKVTWPLANASSLVGNFAATYLLENLLQCIVLECAPPVSVQAVIIQSDSGEDYVDRYGFAAAVHNTATCCTDVYSRGCGATVGWAEEASTTHRCSACSAQGPLIATTYES